MSDWGRLRLAVAAGIIALAAACGHERAPLAVDLRETLARGAGRLDRRDAAVTHHHVPQPVVEHGGGCIEDPDVPHDEGPGSACWARHEEGLVSARADEGDDPRRRSAPQATPPAHWAVNPPSATISAPVT